MDGRPKKRQKKLVIESDDEDDLQSHKENLQVSPDTSPKTIKLARSTRVGKRELPTRSRHEAIIHGSSSSIKSKGSTASASRKKNGSANRTTRESTKGQSLKPISAFFTERSVCPVDGAEKVSLNATEEGQVDTIEDDSSQEEQHRLPRTLHHINGPQKLIGRTLDLGGTKSKEATQVARKTQPPQTTTKGVKDIHSSPWSDRYAPVSIDEVAVNIKKVRELRGHLEQGFLGISQVRLLVLIGPSGSGKSTTLNILARELDCEIVEWKSPAGGASQAGHYSTMSAQFDEFVNRSRQAPGLQLSMDDSQIHHSHGKSTSKHSYGRSKLIVVEDMPSNAAPNSSMLQAFRASVLQYLSAEHFEPEKIVSGHGTSAARNMIVFIFADSAFSTSTGDDWLLTPRNVLGSEILDDPRSTTIEFKPIAMTFLEKALNLVIKKACGGCSFAQRPPPDAVKKLSRLGDARRATNALEMLCTMPQPIVGSSIGRGQDFSAHHDINLGLFHAIGKVVYNKRDTERFSSSVVDPPSHMSRHARPFPSQVDVDGLLDKTSTDSGTFVAALFENFAPSCSGPDASTSLDSCLELLSDADLLDSPRANFGLASSSSLSNELIKHGQFAFEVAVRGLLFALPQPVQRKAQAEKLLGGRVVKSDVFKMAFPALFRIHRERKEMEDLMQEIVYNGSKSSRRTGSHGSSQTDHSRSLFPAVPEMVCVYLPYSSIIKSPDLDAEAKLCSHIALSRYTDRSLHSVSGQIPKARNRNTMFGGMSRIWQGRNQTLLEQASLGARNDTTKEEDRDLLYLEDDDIEDD